MSNTVWKLLLLQLILILPFYLTSHFYTQHLEQSKYKHIAEYFQAHRKSMSNEATSQNIPVRLIIPSINVDTTIEPVGLTPSGAMDTPNNATNVGWFNLGSRPGEIGSAVIDGHFDSENSANGVFLNLSELRKGDSIQVEDSAGTTKTFVVRESHEYDPGYLEDVFTRSDGSHLNLITCDGVWDKDKKSFDKRLIVFADLQ